MFKWLIHWLEKKYFDFVNLNLHPRWFYFGSLSKNERNKIYSKFLFLTEFTILINIDHIMLVPYRGKYVCRVNNSWNEYLFQRERNKDWNERNIQRYARFNVCYARLYLFILYILMIIWLKVANRNVKNCHVNFILMLYIFNVSNDNRHLIQR